MSYFKPRSQASQNSFIKQYQNFLLKNRKITPRKAQLSYSPLFKQSKQQINLRVQTSPSPQKSKRTHCLSTHLPTENSQYNSEKDDKSSVTVLQQESQESGIVAILGVIKKEKQVLLNDMKQMTKNMVECKSQYEEMQKQSEQLQHQLQVAKDAKEIHGRSTDTINDTYLQMIALLRGLQIDYQDVLPHLENVVGLEDCEEQIRKPDKDEIVILQKLIIKKLVKKIEDQKQLNQLLLTKIKENGL